MREIISLALYIFILNKILVAETDKASSIYKEKLAIIEFQNNTEYKNLGKAITDEITTLLVQTKRFEIIERERINEILKEQEFQMTGLVNEKDTVKFGSLIAAKYLLFGSITSANAIHSEEEVTIKEKNKTGTKETKYILTKWNGKVIITAKFVDVATGKIIFAKTVTGQGYEESKRKAEDQSYIQSILSLIKDSNIESAREVYFKRGDERVIDIALKNASLQIVNDFIKEFPLTGYIVGKLEDKDRYIIDLGSESGLNCKANLKILGKEEKIVHPVTGEFISAKREEVGYLKVERIENNYSEAKFVKGEKEKIIPGLKVEVVDPIFVWHRALASFFVPGFGQFLEKRFSSGIAFFLIEASLIGGAYYCYYRSSDKFLSKQPLFDTTLWSQQKGEVYKNAKNQALTGMWILIVVETIFHIWDTIDAGYPAEKYRPISCNINSDFYAINLYFERAFKF